MIRCRAFNTHARRRFPVGRCNEAVRRVLRAEKVGNAEVSVVLTGDAAMRRLNLRWRGHRGSTDVLSFPLGDSETLEGELYVNLDRAEQQAREYGIPYGEEVVRLIVHGVLHLAGYDDTAPPRARRMKKREDGLVERLAGRSRR
jgi:probable rRNA maturation factor